MIHTVKLTSDITSMVTTLVPEVDEVKLRLKLEEVLANYEIKRKSYEEMESDILEHIELFIDAKRLEGLSEITLKHYRSTLCNFSEELKKPVVHVKTPDIRSFLGKMKGAKASTISKKLSILKSFFGWLRNEDIILSDPTAKIALPKKEKRMPKALTIEELELVRESCKTLRQRALLEVLYSTGGRLSEIVQLNKDSINYQAMSAKIIGKGNKERTVFFDFKAMHYLKKYLNYRNDDCVALFVSNRKPNARLSHRGIQREIDKIEQNANIQKRLTPHIFRHTYATLSMDRGIELTDLQHLLGHSNPATTLIYGNVSEERKQQAYKKFHVL